MEKECQHCGKIITYNTPQQLGGHIGNCKKNPKVIDRIENNKKKKDYSFECKKCGKEYHEKITENNFNKGRYKKYCSITCANSRTRSFEVKSKISNGVIKYYDNNANPRIIEKIKKE